MTAVTKREAVVHLQASYGMSERRACRGIVPDHKIVRYCCTRDGDTTLGEKLRELANQRGRLSGLNVVNHMPRECLSAVPET